MFCAFNITLINNIEGKITECWLVNEEGIFFLILLVKWEKLLGDDWSSGCLAIAYAIEKLLLNPFFDNASRFEVANEEYIKELKNKSENENTKKSNEYWKNVFITGQLKETSRQTYKSTRTMSSTRLWRSFMSSYQKKTRTTTIPTVS